jgi:hypothetical protein
MQLQVLGTEDLILYCTFFTYYLSYCIHKSSLFQTCFFICSPILYCEGSRYLQVFDFFGRKILFISLMNIIAMNK